MKKINLFNRNTNLPSYRRMPVSRGFNRGGGIPLFSGMTAVIFALFIATPSFAEPTELDKKTVASKAYVDTKQDIIETGLVSLGDDWIENLPSVVSFDSTSGLVGNKYGILDLNGSMDYIDDGWWNYVGDSDVEYLIPTVGAVGRELQGVRESMPYWSPLPWSVNNDNGVNRTNAINAYNTEFGNGTNQWAGVSDHLINGQFLANSLALKQNKIDAQNTSLVPGQQVENGVPSSVIAATAMPGVVQQVALWDADGGDPASWDVNTYFSGATANERKAINYSIPTVGAVEAGLSQKQNKLPAKSTGNAAPKGKQAVVLDAAGYPSNVYTTAGKDLALTAKSGAQRVMNYIDGTTASATFATSQGLTEAQVKSALVSLELLKDVYSELNSKITNNALPTGTTGTVVTYNGVNAETGVQEFGERAVYNPANAYNAQNDATKLATAGFVETKQNKMVCAGWDSETHTDEHCWLWSIE